MYKIINRTDERTNTKVASGVLKTNLDGSDVAIPLDPENTDYANFKREINEETAQLEDADGNLMSAQQAKAYVATLP